MTSPPAAPLPPPPSGEGDLASAPLFDHLDELRRRLIISVLFLALGMAVAFVYRVQLIDLVKEPLNFSQMYREGKVKVVTLQLTAPLMLSFNLSFWAGLALALPLMLTQVWAFISPGLYPHERRWALPFILGAGFAFLCGVVFAFKLVLPAMVPFLVEFLGSEVQPQLDLQDYIGRVVAIMASMGLAFELPILALILTRIGLVNHVMLRRGWRVALVIIMILAALITPTPDPVNMLIVALPLYALYELGVLLSRMFRVVPPEEDRTLLPGR
ncbi:Sec-independent protein translocase TatC [Deinococcus reticulitermitis]|uniref:Sec-independent protein translocase protein TatC n=1 Tax=Deinococcus reticulitermitis TaxID=856736 RepID=A0A1H6XHB1_9DEIO|nr:twin-arginine translocase subunit TatC [Deinococcus reticulitermitis]SEJ23975.1 Sec-independent protein translocase TatC [Deinococcus reticulitermitis]